MAARKALLHWCAADNVSDLIDNKSVLQGKPVRMRADWLAGYQKPATFEIHEEVAFLKRLFRKLGNHWHPIQPFLADTPTPGMSVSRDVWKTGVSDVTRQSHYYFTDDSRHKSGRLTVSNTQFWVDKAGLSLSGIDLSAPPVGVEMSLNLEIGHETIRHGLGASKDPELGVEMLTPWSYGELNLVEHARRLVVERLVQQARQDGYEPSPDEFPSNDDLIAAADGFLNPERIWGPDLDEDSHVLVVDEHRTGQVNVVIPPLALDAPFRTAYALRIVDVEDPSRYVISDVVMLDSDGFSLHIRG